MTTFYHSNILLENFEIDPYAHVDFVSNSVNIEFKEGAYRKKSVKKRDRKYVYEHLVFTIAHKDLKYPDFVIFCDHELEYYYVVKRENLVSAMQHQNFKRYTNITLKKVKNICETCVISMASLKEFIGVIKK